MTEPRTAAGRNMATWVKGTGTLPPNVGKRICEIEAEARAAALDEARAAVESLPQRMLDDDGDGYGGVAFVHLGSILAAIDALRE